MSVILIMMLALPVLAISWAYAFVVWDDYIYVIGDEYIQNIGEELGEVTAYSDMEQFGDNFSNSYPKGTKYYEIEKISTDIAIAVQAEDEMYIKAIRDGEYIHI